MKFIYSGADNVLGLPINDVRREKLSALSRRCLQAMVSLAAFVPVSAGLAGICLGPKLISHAETSSIPLDSHFRYLSGLLLGLGLGFWSSVPNIQQKTHCFQLLSFLVIVGGLGRMISFLVSGTPNPVMFFGFGMELVVMPLLATWQFRVSRSA